MLLPIAHKLGRRLRFRPMLAALMALLAALLCVGPAAAAPIPDGAFVRVQGGAFVIGSQPFHFVGANIDPLHGDINRPRYQEILGALGKDGLTVGRIWALGEDVATAGPWLRQHALFRAGPDDFIEDSYQLLDRVLVAARQAGIRLIITLSNHWKDYGGIPMYLRWAGKSADGLGFEEFYSDDRARTYFKQGLLRLLSRINSVTGVPYIDDPTIFSWELMNESTVLSSQGQAARLRWIGEVTQLIRAYDKNHLIAAGLFGYSQRREREEWIRIHQLPEIDYADSHLYMQNSEGGVSPQRMYDFLDDRAQLASYVIRKPLVIGEFGFRTDGPRQYLGLSRAEWFERFLRRHFRNKGAGALVWIYQPYWGKPRDYGIYIDRHDTDDVRAVLRRTASHLRTADGPSQLRGVFGPLNSRLGPTQGSEPLYQQQVTLFGTSDAHSRWQHPRPGEHVLAIPPQSYQRARFERVGSWDGSGGSIVHIYGGDTGEFSYRFTPPAFAHPLAAVELEARVSSEWPGVVAPRGGGSNVELLVDGVVVGRFGAPPDDGIGERRRVRITDGKILSRLRSGAHTLVFRVPYSDGAHGICIYGDSRSSEPAPAGEFSPILIRYLAPR